MKTHVTAEAKTSTNTKTVRLHGGPFDGDSVKVLEGARRVYIPIPGVPSSSAIRAVPTIAHYADDEHSSDWWFQS